MKYLISINSNFPNREYGKFSCREGELEYLLFREVEPIDLTIRLDFINFEAVAEKWDCIPTNKVHIYLLNPKAMALFEEYYTGKFEWIDADIYSDNSLIDSNHKLLHIMNHSQRDTIFYDKGIWVNEKFVKDFKTKKLKGWVFYGEKN